MNTSQKFSEARAHLSKAAHVLKAAVGDLEGSEREAAELLHADVGLALRKARNFETLTGTSTRRTG